MVLEADVDLAAVEPFLQEGMVAEVLDLIKSGKEANAYLCRGGREAGRELAVLKIYHSRERRNFARSSLYTQGRLVLNGQVRRAINARSEFGKDAEAAMWVNYEFDNLSAAYDAGTDVPEPIACEGSGLLMEYIGDEREPAPQLQYVSLDREEAEVQCARLLSNIEQWLGVNLVHGDLSPYNILYWKGRCVAIDFPQAVDPRFNDSARSLLERDVTNVAKYFARMGVRLDVQRETTRMWGRFVYSQL